MRRVRLAAFLLIGYGCSGDGSDGEMTDGGVADASADAGGCTPTVIEDCTDGWCRIPAGCFVMGSPSTEPCRRTSEDQHPVTLTHGFLMQSTEVTQGQFAQRMGYNPSTVDGMSCGSNCPVHRVNKHEAMAYCNALSSETGLAACYSCTGTGADVTCEPAASFGGAQIYTCPGYRLPTDAEWEYAYRAGTTTAYYNGSNDGTVCDTCSSVDTGADQIAWYCANYDNMPLHQVGQKQANAWGLHDMAGNVAEWCQDSFVFFLGTDPVTDPFGSGSINDTLRGGHWGEFSTMLRAAARLGAAPSTRLDNLGFRCVRTR